MPILPYTTNYALIEHLERRDTRMIRTKALVAQSPATFFMDAGDLYSFIELLSGKSVVEKVPYKEELALCKFGAWKGKVWMAPDFDDDQEIIELFEGSEKPPDGDD